MPRAVFGKESTTEMQRVNRFNPHWRPGKGVSNKEKLALQVGLAPTGGKRKVAEQGHSRRGRMRIATRPKDEMEVQWREAEGICWPERATQPEKLGEKKIKAGSGVVTGRAGQASFSLPCTVSLGARVTHSPNWAD